REAVVLLSAGVALDPVRLSSPTRRSPDPVARPGPAGDGQCPARAGSERRAIPTPRRPSCAARCAGRAGGGAVRARGQRHRAPDCAGVTPPGHTDSRTVRLSRQRLAVTPPGGMGSDNTPRSGRKAIDSTTGAVCRGGKISYLPSGGYAGVVHFTRVTDLLLAGLIGLGAGYLVFDVASSQIPRLPVGGGGLLAVLAVIEGGLALWVKARIKQRDR